MKSAQPRAAPKAISPRAATLLSRSRKAGSPKAAAISSAIGTSTKVGPMLGVCTTTPRQRSTGPGQEIPMPSMASLVSAGTASLAAFSAPAQARRIAAGPWATGVVS